MSLISIRIGIGLEFSARCIIIITQSLAASMDVSRSPIQIERGTRSNVDRNPDSALELSSSKEANGISYVEANFRLTVQNFEIVSARGYE